MHDGSRHDLGNGRAARHFDDRHAGNDLVDGRGLRWGWAWRFARSRCWRNCPSRPLPSRRRRLPSRCPARCGRRCSNTRRHWPSARSLRPASDIRPCISPSCCAAPPPPACRRPPSASPCNPGKSCPGSRPPRAGWEERMKDSEQQVHSWKWNQSTGRRGLVSRAFVTCGHGAGGQAEHGGHPGTGGKKVAPRYPLGLRMLPNGGTGVVWHNQWFVVRLSFVLSSSFKIALTLSGDFSDNYCTS